MEQSNKESRLIEKLKAFQLNTLLDWQSEAEFFIPLRASYSAFNKDDFPLEEDIENFLLGDKKLMLLLGDSGSGKSLFTQGLIARKWQNYQSKTIIPLWISLPSLKNPIDKAIEETLQKAGLTTDEIETLRRENQFLFILDGYDEIRQIENLYISNRLQRWQAKVIITCRREYLYHIDNYAIHFTPFVNERAQHSAYQERVIKPFSAEQIDRYLEQFVEHGGTEWAEWQRYRAGIDEIPGLAQFLSSPFMLKLAMSVLPSLLERYRDRGEERVTMTRTAIYDAFTAQWFESQEAKLKLAGEINEDEDEKPAFWNYAKSLALAMHTANLTVVHYEAEESLFDDEVNPWTQFFAPDDRRVALLQTACLVREIAPNEFAFAHASLSSYFMTRYLYEDILIAGLGQHEPREEVAEERTSAPVRPSDEQSYFNQASIVKDNEAIQFSADKLSEVGLGEILKERYFGFIQASKNNEGMSIAAANAITILNRAKINFSGMDFSEVHIPNADLSAGLFHRTDFQRANLSGVKFINAYLADALLSGANLTDIDLGRHPNLRLSEQIIAIIRSPNKEHLAVAVGKYIEIWDITKSQLIAKLEGHEDKVTTLTYTANGERIFSGSEDKTARLWDASTGQLLRTLYGHEDIVTSVACHPQNRQLLSASKDGTILQWTNKDRLIRIIKSRHNQVNAITYSPDGTKFASVGADGGVRQWSVATGKLLTINKHNSDAITCVAYSPDNRLLATGTNKELCQWSVATGQLVSKQTDEIDNIKCMIYSLDCNSLINGDSKGRVYVRSVATGYVQEIYQGNSTTEITGILFSLDNKCLIASSSRNIYKWKIKSRQSNESSESSQQREWRYQLDYSVNGRFLYISHLNGPCLYSLNDGSMLSQINALECYRLAISTNGKRLLVGDACGYVKQWSIGNQEIKPLTARINHDSCINAVAYSKDGRRMASASKDGIVIQWSTATGKLLTKSANQFTSIQSVVYSPDSKFLAVRGRNGIIQIWDAETGKVLEKITANDSDNANVVYSNDGKYLAFSRSDNVICQWSVNTKEVVAEYHINLSTMVCYSPDGHFLIAGGTSKIYIWHAVDFNNTDEIADIYIGRNGVHSLTITSQNDIIAIIGTHGVVNCWSYQGSLNKPMWLLKWSSLKKFDELIAYNCDVDDVIGLSAINRRMFLQMGAVGLHSEEYSGDDFYELVASDNKRVVQKLLKCGIHKYIDFETKIGINPLMNCIIFDNHVLLREMLKWKPYLANSKFEEKWLLVHAILLEHYNCVVELLQAGAKIDDRTLYPGKLPIHIAVLKNNSRIVELLLDSGSDINDTNSSGETPLHLAARKGYVDIVRTLLAKGADANIETYSEDMASGDRAIDMAAEKGFDAIVNLLLQHENADGLQIRKYQEKLNEVRKIKSSKLQLRPSLIDAVKQGNLEKVKVYLDPLNHCNATDKEGLALLHHSACSGHAEVAEYLISKGSRVNIRVPAIDGHTDAQNNTPLHFAAKLGHEAVVVLLLKHKADVNCKNANRSTPLQYACANGYVNIVNILLDYNADANVVDCDGWSALHFAAKAGLYELVFILLNRKVVATAKEKKEGQTPLHLSASRGDSVAVKLLLTHGAQMQGRDKEGRTALHLAAANGHLEVVKVLFLQGVKDIEAKTNKGETALLCAAMSDVYKKEMIDLILMQGADPFVMDKEGMTLFHCAAFHNDITTMKRFLSLGIDVNTKLEDGVTLLHIVASLGKLEIVKMLLAMKANVNVKENMQERTPLALACMSGSVEVVQQLLAHHANIEERDIDGATALHLAVHKDQLVVQGILLESGADINSRFMNGASPLHIAVQEGHVMSVEFLLVNRPNLEAVDDDGLTPLHYAVHESLLIMVEILLLHGADLEAKTNEGETPLHYAYLTGNAEIINLLEKRGANKRAKNNFGTTMLHQAAAGGNLELVRNLHNNGDLECPNSYGRRPLHLASKCGHVEVVRFLLESRAKVNIQDTEFGNTPLHWSAAKGHQQVVDLLCKHGADITILSIQGLTAQQLAAESEHPEVKIPLPRALPKITSVAKPSRATTDFFEQGEERKSPRKKATSPPPGVSPPRDRRGDEEESDDPTKCVLR